MKKYLISDELNSYKANLHTHSTCSDGGLTPEEIKEHYKERGYSIISYTDHDVFITHNELTDPDFLVLNGYELEVNQPAAKVSPITKNGKTCHMCLIALEPDKETPVCWHREKYIPAKSIPHKDEVKFDPNVPDYDRERVYLTHIKKMYSWYNILVANGVTDFVDAEADTEGEAAKEETAE